MSERINEPERIDESGSTTSGWNSLFDIPFRDAETQEFDRAELEQQTFDKLNKNRSAKKTFQRIILGVAVAAALIGGVTGVFNNSEQGGTSRPVRIEEVIEAADAFVDKILMIWFGLRKLLTMLVEALNIINICATRVNRMTKCYKATSLKSKWAGEMVEAQCIVLPIRMPMGNGM